MSAWQIQPAPFAADDLFREGDAVLSRSDDDGTLLLLPPLTSPRSLVQAHKDLHPTRWIRAKWEPGVDPGHGHRAAADNIDLRGVVEDLSPPERDFAIRETRVIAEWLEGEEQIRVRSDRVPIRKLGCDFAAAAFQLRMELEEVED